MNLNSYFTLNSFNPVYVKYFNVLLTNRVAVHQVFEFVIIIQRQRNGSRLM